VTTGPNALVGPLATRSRSPFSSITRITGTTDFYEVTNPYGLAPGNYTIYVRPVNRNGLSLDGVGRVAVIKQAGGRDNPNATSALVALKRPNSVDSPLVLGPFTVTTADRLYVALERKGVAEVKYQLQLEGPDSALRDDLWAKAGAVPSLDLRLATSKSLVDSVSGQNLVTFTRASSGTYVDADGLIKTAANDVPRFDHNPLTGESLGLLVEESRANLLLWSEVFDNASWMKNSLSVTANSTLSPAGTVSADTLIEDTSTSQHNIRQSISTTGAKRFSVYAKQGPGSRLLRLVDFNPTDGSQGATFFNLSSGTVAAGSGTIEIVGDGWYRCSIQSTTTVTSDYFISLASNSSTITYAGDGASGIYIWGAQLEAGAFPTSYIPTTTAAATRSADVASITGTNFSSWYRQDEGTILGQSLRRSLLLSGAFANLASLSDGTSSEQYTLYNQGSNQSLNFQITNDAANQAVITPSGTVAQNSLMSFGCAYKINDFAAAVNAGSASLDSSGTLPTVNRMNIGAFSTGGGYWNAHIHRLTYWPVRLGNNVLQQVTQ
jgi:hypothetical protein